MTLALRTCVALAALLFVPGVAGAAAIALTGATVHTVSGPTLENATVVMENGRITAVGRDLAIPAGAEIVRCMGKHVFPGFVSPYTVLGLTEIASVRGTNDYQETGSTNPDIRAEVQINPDSDLLPVARVNGITSALVAPRGGALSGTSALIHLDGWTWEDMTVSAPVGLHVQWPNMTPVHAWWQRKSDEEQKKDRDQAIANLRKAFDDARAYWKARDAEGQSGIPRHDRDVKWDAMRKALRGEIPVMITAPALNQIEAALAFAEEEKLPRVVLVNANDAWRVADELKRRGIAVITSGVLGPPARDDEPYDQTFSVPHRLYQAGVTFCISDGGGVDDAMNARNLPYNAAMAAAFGLPRDEALKAVTLSPARILGVGDRLGSIEPGKIADLVVADGDPLEIATHVERVYIAGRAIPMENRQSRLFEKYDDRPRGPKARKR